MNNITTYNRISMNPAKPQPEDINIDDIAHALSLLCRANGHIEWFFSVAQHSINCAREAEARGFTKTVQLAALLHDASEAYLSDITRPVKLQLPGYRVIEENLQEVIDQVFFGRQLSIDEKKLVSELDDGQLYYEFLFFWNERVFEQEPLLLSKPEFSYRDFKHTEQEFLQLYNALKNNLPERLS